MTSKQLGISDLYPKNLSNNEILELIEKLSNEANRYNINLSPNHCITLIELGQTELNQRIQSKLLDSIENQRLDNKRSGKLNKGLSILTIVLALITLYFGFQSLSFAQLDKESDDKWSDSQIEMLRNNNSELIKTNQELIKINTELRDMTKLLEKELNSKVKNSK